MQCKKIQVENFRNIEQASVEFGPRVNLLLGDNAQGKTNLLEAISLMAIGKSFRGAKDADLIRFGQDKATVVLDYCDHIRDMRLTATLMAGRRRKMEQNGLPVAKMSELIGGLRVVLFCPEHLSIIKSGPELRRNFLDVAISQLKPVYMSSLMRYNKILKERNRLIKEASESENARRIMQDTIDIWSEQLAREGAVIARYRVQYIQKMKKAASVVFSDMTDGGEVPNFSYVGTAHLECEDDYLDTNKTERAFLNLLTASHAREIGAGYTLWGIHRDDIDITLNGVCARIFASQGQQRSLALAMKLAEGEICRESCSEHPVYLFDDVLSELDTRRRDYLTSRIYDKQVILTTCEPSELKRLGEANVIKVQNGTFSTL
ncbi:MAG: DNA replication/repair protein RecF [Clostridia bacterium]|nr:DNA replication/repair protein RecF [Clostridia bacterium]MBR5797428.1 DNA replication/repair protein RecF [Clostridia bacterium]